MTENIHESVELEYNDVIPKDSFVEFLDILMELDVVEYNNEIKDGFKDLYNYWTNCGTRRFLNKLITNRENLRIKQSNIV